MVILLKMLYVLLHFIATVLINRGLSTELKGEYSFIVNMVSVFGIIGGFGLDLLYLECNLIP